MLKHNYLLPRGSTLLILFYAIYYAHLCVVRMAMCVCEFNTNNENLIRSNSLQSISILLSVISQENSIHFTKLEARKNCILQIHSVLFLTLQEFMLLTIRSNSIESILVIPLPLMFIPLTNRKEEGTKKRILSQHHSQGSVSRSFMGIFFILPIRLHTTGV